MELTYWDTHPRMKTSSALLAPDFPEHYHKLQEYFEPTDVILDVGCGTNRFSEYIPNATGVDETHGLMTYDLSNYNTLHFSETIGYISHEVLTRLISSKSIKKVVIKDFLTDKIPTGVEEYFKYDFTTLNNFLLPLLEQNGYAVKVQHFFPYIQKFIDTMKEIGLNFVSEGKTFFIRSSEPYDPIMKPVIVSATKP